MSAASDETLISRIIDDGDPEAFGQLVRKYQSDVRRLLRRLTAPDVSAADDLAQETFLKAYRYLPGFKRDCAMATWLYKIAYNQFLNSRRRKNIIEYREDAECGFRGDGGRTGDGVLDKIDLERAMQLLEPDERMVLTLNFRERLSHAQIARIMDMPLGTIKTRIANAKQRLKRVLSDGYAKEGGT